MNLFDQLTQRMSESLNYIQVIAGPRQVGKTTSVLAWQKMNKELSLYDSADDQGLMGVLWIENIWNRGRVFAQRRGIFTIILDEIQKISGWSETVKKLWDEDRRNNLNLQVILLGSSRLLLQKGLGESLAGRYEMIRARHWSWPEIQQTFDISFEDYLIYGSYPGATRLIKQPKRWIEYIKDSLVHSALQYDIFELEGIRKPVLLKNLFELGCIYSGKGLSYNKLLGQLQDAGNTTTLAHYLNLLNESGLLAGLERFAPEGHRQKASSPKFCVWNSALYSAFHKLGPVGLFKNPEERGHLVESAVGAHLLNRCWGTDIEVLYWNESDFEVDFVLKRGEDLVAIEVKSASKNALWQRGIKRFSQKFTSKIWLVGDGGLPLEGFFDMEPSELF
jgi:predicted AAA+ superfamily ATPase